MILKTKSLTTRHDAEHYTGAVLLFSKCYKIFIVFLDPENIFLNNEKNNFQGDLTDISAKKEALYGGPG